MKAKAGSPAITSAVVFSPPMNYSSDNPVARQYRFALKSPLVILDYFTGLYDSVHVSLQRHPEGSGGQTSANEGTAPDKDI